MHPWPAIWHQDNKVNVSVKECRTDRFHSFPIGLFTSSSSLCSKKLCLCYIQADLLFLTLHKQICGSRETFSWNKWFLLLLSESFKKESFVSFSLRHASGNQVSNVWTTLTFSKIPNKETTKETVDYFFVVTMLHGSQSYYSIGKLVYFLLDEHIFRRKMHLWTK